jgi:hypothetical protein
MSTAFGTIGPDSNQILDTGIKDHTVYEQASSQSCNALRRKSCNSNNGIMRGTMG